MSKLFTDYIQSVSSKFSYKETSEMGYRADFEKLIRGIFESIRVTRIDHDPQSKEGNKGGIRFAGIGGQCSSW